MGSKLYYISLKAHWCARQGGIILVRLMVIILYITPALLSVSCSIPSQAAIVDVSGIEVPPVNGPVCANCDGAGCDQCQPSIDYGDDDSDDDDTVPIDNNNSGLTTNPNPVQGTNSTPVNNTPAIDPQQVFDQRKEELLKEFKVPAGLMDDTSIPSSTSPVVVINENLGGGQAPTGLSDSEWKEAAECQQGLDALYAKWPLSANDIALADKLEERRNQLWKKAISVPGLTAEERERLRLKLHTFKLHSSAIVPTISEETIKQWQKPPDPPPSSTQTKPSPPTVNPVASWLVGEFALGQAQGAVELGGELWADYILEENKFGDFLGVSKIALAYKEGGVASAIAETANFLVGKISIPQANIAVEGGRIYSNIVYQVQNKFMTDAMKVAGGEFDKQKFWSDFNEDCNIGQKAVKEWIGYGKD